MESGSDLSSRAVSSQVLSALKGLTSVFGMGTGGTPSSLPPEIVNFLKWSIGCFRGAFAPLPFLTTVALYHAFSSLSSSFRRFPVPIPRFLCSFLCTLTTAQSVIQIQTVPISLFVFVVRISPFNLSSAVIKPSTY